MRPWEQRPRPQVRGGGSSAVDGPDAGLPDPQQEGSGTPTFRFEAPVTEVESPAPGLRAPSQGIETPFVGVGNPDAGATNPSAGA